MGPTPSLYGQTPLANWRRRILILLAGAVVIAGGFFGVKWWWAEWTARQAEADLHVAIAEVAAAEPNGWQLEDLERQREKIPAQRVCELGDQFEFWSWNPKHRAQAPIPPPRAD